METTIRFSLIACALVALLFGGTSATAYAQAPRHTPLTQQQIDNLIAVELEIAPVMAKLPKTGDDGLQRALVPIEKKHGFASDGEFAAVMTSVQLVLMGVDRDRKVFVGPAYLRGLIAVLEADRTLLEARRLAALNTLREQLKGVIAAGTPPPSNVELVVKNYDRLRQAVDGLSGSE